MGLDKYFYYVIAGLLIILIGSLKIGFSLQFSQVLRQIVFLDLINIQVHRSAIGLYSDKAQSFWSKEKCRLSFFVDSYIKRIVKISRYLNLKIALVVLICLRLLIQAIISGMQLKGGDMETNLVPTYKGRRYCMGPFIREIVDYLVKLQAFSVHVMHYIHYVRDSDKKKYFIGSEETWIIF